MNTAVSFEPSRRPQPCKKESEQHGDDAENHFKLALVRAKRASETSEERAKTDEDDGKAGNERQRARDGAPFFGAPTGVPARSTKKCDVAREERKHARRYER